MRSLMLVIFLVPSLIVCQPIDSLEIGKTLYIGEVISGKIEGYAKEYIGGKLVFEGEFSRGERNGFGREKFDEFTFEGIWENGVFIKGKSTSSLNNRTYEGEWENGHFMKGTVDYGNGYKIEGEFRKLLPNGDGTMFFSNGTQIVTSFKNGKPKGQAFVQFQNDTSLEGVWHRTSKDVISLIIKTTGTGSDEVATFLNGDPINIYRQ